ncbi:MAG: hypothetical protein IPH16_01635 [Haliscomenobacter sp.]|nr:hypothetical protein [Haliscomenobacter sp.]
MKKPNPHKKPPIRFEETQAAIQKISRHLDGDFLSYWVSTNSRIALEDVNAFYKILKDRVGHERLFLFIKSDGGSGKGSLRIVHLLRAYYKEIIALVPLECASAATMLALGANEIRMGPLAFLSAIDTSITHDLSPVDKYNDLVSVSQNELERVMRLWEAKRQPHDQNPYNAIYQYIHPLVFGAVDRASSLSIKLTTEILSYHLTDLDQANRISTHLNEEYPSHSYHITLLEARKTGLNIQEMDVVLNDLLITLNEYYSEMAQLAYTDKDEQNYHDNEILKFVETTGEQLFFQKDKDWHYRKEEMRWVPMNDESSWQRNVWQNGKVKTEKFFVR